MDKENPVSSDSNIASEANTSKKGKRFQKLRKIFTFKSKKKKVLLLLLVIILGLAGFLIYYQNKQNNNAQPQIYYTQPQKLGMTGWITNVYDGDLSTKPSISIYNRVIKVGMRLKLTQYNTISLTDTNQVRLISKGSSYYPISMSTITLTQNDQYIEFFFELNRDLMPEAVIIKHESIESPLEMIIDTKNNYSINKDLNLVFDDNSNKEYVELQQKLSALVDNPATLSIANLPNIDLILRTPSNNELNYRNGSNQSPSTNAYYQPYYSKCYTINPDTLKPTTNTVGCKSYNITYKVETDSRLLGVSRIISVYSNSYPQELVGQLGSHDSIREIDTNILGQKLKITEIDSTGSKLDYVIVKSDSGDIYVITTSKSAGYQMPIEITEFEEKLMFKVLETIKYELQEDVIEEAKEVENPSTPSTTPTSYPN